MEALSGNHLDLVFDVEITLHNFVYFFKVPASCPTILFAWQIDTFVMGHSRLVSVIPNSDGTSDMIGENFCQL